MKKYIKIITTVISMLILTSCSEDWLEIAQKGVLEVDVTYATATDAKAEQLVLPVYNQFWTVNNNQYIQVFTYLDGTVVGNGNAYQDANNFAFQYYSHDPDNGYLRTLYSALYTLIYRSNMIIDKMPDDTPYKQRVHAEAKFFRAYAHMMLLMIFENPPFMPKVPETDEELYPKNGDPAVIWPWIEQNFKDAAAVLPQKSGLNAQVELGGRLTKHTAMAFLGKAYLTQGKYTEAEDVLGDIITSNLYGLVEDMSTLFRPATDFCKEYLFEMNVEYSKDFNTIVDNRYTEMGWRANKFKAMPVDFSTPGWGQQMPHRDFALFFTDHEAVTDTTFTQRYHRYIKTYEDVMSMQYPGATKGILPNQTLWGGSGWFGYRWYCFVADLVENTGLGQGLPASHANIPAMRYSEVLLNYAEACAMLGQTSGPGLDALNEVRTRAGLPEAATLSMGGDEGVKKEFKSEFWAEGVYWFCLTRWGDAYNELKNHGNGTYMFQGYLVENNTVQSPAQWKWQYNTTYVPPVHGFVEGKHEYLPIPNVELSANPNLVQNSHWD